MQRNKIIPHICSRYNKKIISTLEHDFPDTCLVDTAVEELQRHCRCDGNRDGGVVMRINLARHDGNDVPLDVPSQQGKQSRRSQAAQVAQRRCPSEHGQLVTWTSCARTAADECAQALGQPCVVSRILTPRSSRRSHTLGGDQAELFTAQTSTYRQRLVDPRLVERDDAKADKQLRDTISVLGIPRAETAKPIKLWGQWRIDSTNTEGEPFAVVPQNPKCVGERP
jgi:hypothetical protein